MSTFSSQNTDIRASGYDADSVDQTLQPSQLGAIFAGVVVALVVQALLPMLGLGIGVATLDPGTSDNPDGATFSIVAGIWCVVAGIIAAFAGGYISATRRGRRARLPRWFAVAPHARPALEFTYGVGWPFA